MRLENQAGVLCVRLFWHFLHSCVASWRCGTSCRPLQLRLMLPPLLSGRFGLMLLSSISVEFFHARGWGPGFALYSSVRLALYVRVFSNAPPNTLTIVGASFAIVYVQHTTTVVTAAIGRSISPRPAPPLSLNATVQYHHMPSVARPCRTCVRL